MSRTVNFVALALLALAAAPAAAAEKSFMVTDFESVAASGAHNVVVTTGKAVSVRAVGARKDLDRLKIEVAGDTLKIGHKKNGDWFSWSSDSDAVTIFVTTRELRGARLSGSGDMAVDRMTGSEVRLAVSGSGDLNVGVLKAEALDVSVAGSGNVAVTGNCGKAEISIAGSGNVEAAGLKCQTLAGNVAGSGNIKADVAKTADLKVMGSGDITVTGSARCEVSTMGSGRIRCGADS